MGGIFVYFFNNSFSYVFGVRGSATSDGIFIESSPSPWQPEQATCSLEGRANCVAKAGGEASKGAPINVALGPARIETLHNLHTALRGLLSVPHYATLSTIHYATLPQATTPVAVRYRWPMRERAPLHRALAFCDQAHRSSRHVFRPSKTIQGTCCWQSLSPNRPTGHPGGGSDSTRECL